MRNRITNSLNKVRDAVNFAMAVFWVGVLIATPRPWPYRFRTTRLQTKRVPW